MTAPDTKDFDQPAFKRRSEQTAEVAAPPNYKSFADEVPPHPSSSLKAVNRQTREDNIKSRRARAELRAAEIQNQ